MCDESKGAHLFFEKKKVREGTLRALLMGEVLLVFFCFSRQSFLSTKTNRNSVLERTILPEVQETTG